MWRGFSIWMTVVKAELQTATTHDSRMNQTSVTPKVLNLSRLTAKISESSRFRAGFSTEFPEGSQGGTTGHTESPGYKKSASMEANTKI